VRGWDPSARLLGIVRYHAPGDLDPVIEALFDAGVPLVEVTLDTPGALDAVARWRAAGRAVGTGTVVSGEQVDASVDAGAAFVVSPGVAEDVIERARGLGVDVVLGAFTPTEVLRARELGAAAVKLFPASTGGPAHVRALRGPLADVPLVPTGGIGVEDVTVYLEAGASCVGLGGALVGAAAPTRASELDAISARAAAAVAAADRAPS
jgi:2-dehydro-3-deoxyphosphogluconate aldolase / (4S)-4-hydroxy-2-oxoglutarate aldolase